MTSLFASAQAKTAAVGLNLNYGTEIESLGLGVKGSYCFTDHIRGEASFNYFFLNPAKRNVLDLKNETCKNREKRNVLKKSHTRHFKAIKKQSRTGCFYSF